jgi:hypothetical protein
MLARMERRAHRQVMLRSPQAAAANATWPAIRA